ncbi:MAG: pirin family protein [Xanthomonadales bacterium]|nr:pirin family protein [Xanthomonadales bacterium]MCB1634800.1 pirin family protein [Xanthomonadales bacterium]
MSARVVTRIVQGTPTSDGAGVRLTRVIGTAQLDHLDPFLMLDEFGTDRPEDYIAGFPNHPHRGFETVTYMLDGRMRHRDNHGNEGLLTPGSVQWMTAGRGIVHSEMPEQEEGRMRGFQLWINLPASAKMQAPRYQEFAGEDIPLLSVAAGVEARLIAGQFGGHQGVISQPATEPLYVDLQLAAEARLAQPIDAGHNAFLYVYEGAVSVADGTVPVRRGQLAVLGSGDEIVLRANEPSRVLLVAGRPLREPVARYGPFVMNTREEIMQAVQDFQAGRF